MTKPTNPKDAAATNKIPHALLSPIAKAYWAVAQFAGMIKYGAWNWRRAGVRSSVYLSAMERHIDAYKSGEEHDPIDGTHHLGNVMACCAILLDAQEADKLTDDRPPIVGLRGVYGRCQDTMATLRTKYADKSPKHYTIYDTEPPVVWPLCRGEDDDDDGTPPAAPMEDAEPSISIGEKIMRRIKEEKDKQIGPGTPALDYFQENPGPQYEMARDFMRKGRITPIQSDWQFEYEREPVGPDSFGGCDFDGFAPPHVPSPTIAYATIN